MDPNNNKILHPAVIAQLYGEQKPVLEWIKDSHQHGIGDPDGIPQIVAVGTHSSGKRSVLEAILGVELPRLDDKYRPFAMEIVFRTSTQANSQVQIQSCNAEKPNPEYSSPFDASLLDKDTFVRIAHCVRQSLSKAEFVGLSYVLRIKITGPDVPNLKVVDFPIGGYNQRRRENIKDGMVYHVTESYMANPNSIFLAVIPADKLSEEQKKLDRHLLRRDVFFSKRVYVITKPDVHMLDSSANESNVGVWKNRLKGQGRWHILHCPVLGMLAWNGGSNLRDASEDNYFKNSHWAEVPTPNRGAESLRKKLSILIVAFMKRDIEKLVGDIGRTSRDIDEQLRRFKEPISTPEDMRKYLGRISQKYNAISLHALEANYSEDSFFDGLPFDEMIFRKDKVRKLRTMLNTLADVFANALISKGSSRIIVPESQGITCRQERIAGASRKLLPFVDQFYYLCQIRNPPEVKLEKFLREAKPEWLANAPGGISIPQLFQDDCQRWEGIANDYITYVFQKTREFVEYLIGHILTHDTTTRSAILTQIIYPFLDEKLAESLRETRKLSLCYRNGRTPPQEIGFPANNIRGLKRRDQLIAEAPMDEASTSEQNMIASLERYNTYYEVSLSPYIMTWNTTHISHRHHSKTSHA